ncbi:metallophosphoesterase domain-containing protein 1 isoform X1 [Hydra vulgaris]|uniref:metallophosphoesterase domain-containing protein 1 isoform X1 n=1 Tax=Hydra vulgaris TaxID=6087 RepID=UPI001F5FC723|nr:metallophosphoesterase domain-containing protein 1-like [Hydra vulgaris]
MLSHKNELESFNNYLGTLTNKFKHIIVIAGNHDISFDDKKWNSSSIVLSVAKTYYLGSPFAKMLSPKDSKSILTNCHYLQDDFIIIDRIKIYGSPWQPPHFDLAFNLTRGSNIMEKWNNIPSDTDILITHGPPLGIGDEISNCYHVGCADLLVTVQDRVKPKFHIFGHIHESHGMWSDGTTTFVNATICDKKYEPVQSPIVFDYYCNK